MTLENQVSEYLKKNPRSRPSVIAKKLGKKTPNIWNVLRLMVAENKAIKEERGLYSISKK